MQRHSPWSQNATGYDTHRPDYAREALDLLWKHARITKESRVVEFGSGTGIFTRHLLDRGTAVICVEPSVELSAVAETKFASHPNKAVLASVIATAQDWLDQQPVNPSYDAIVMATSRKWMDDPAGRFQEGAARILRQPDQAVQGGTITSIRNTPTRDGGGGEIFDATLPCFLKAFGDSTITELPLATELEPEPFGDRFQHVFSGYTLTNQRLTSEEYLARLETYGPIASLNPGERSRLLYDIYNVCESRPFSGLATVTTATVLDIASRQ